MKHIISLTLFLISSFVIGQKNYNVTITFKDLPEKNILLTSFFGDKNAVLDSAFTDESGKVIFTLSENSYSGMYRLIISRNNQLDLIFNKENVELLTQKDHLMDSLVVIQSQENITYYNFLKSEYESQTKLELLSSLVDFYPEDDEFYKPIIEKFSNLQTERENYINKIIADFPESYVSRIIRTFKTPYLSPELKNTERMDYLKEHFFDSISYNDTSLVRSNAITNNLISYLSLFSNRQLSQHQLEDEFIKAVQVILLKADENPVIYEFVMSYLVEGFEKFKFEKVLNFIAENFAIPGKCENEERKSQLQNRLEAFQKLAVGKIAPDISINDTSGNNIKFSDIPEDYTLIIFWASWCPHCTAMFPSLNKLYEEQKIKRWEVLSVSIDSDRAAWLNELSQHHFKWINASEVKGWNSNIANDYNIYATPTMFLLDKNREIIAKPLTVRELTEDLKKIKLL
ncbi:MAG: redoxin domain-containing protein [Bacteroidales bacterium]|nr:redoxin domain-containing protein [Bacteroidales bacterium]